MINYKIVSDYLWLQDAGSAPAQADAWWARDQPTLASGRGWLPSPPKASSNIAEEYSSLTDTCSLRRTALGGINKATKNTFYLYNTKIQTDTIHDVIFMTTRTINVYEGKYASSKVCSHSVAYIFIDGKLRSYSSVSESTISTATMTHALTTSVWSRSGSTKTSTTPTTTMT